MRVLRLVIAGCLLGIPLAVAAQTEGLLENLAQKPEYESHRISSYDRTGDNADRLTIEPGETKVLAEMEGPGAITHMWNTISAERYYPRMLILRIYWDGETTPSVEAPVGDFFAVGHGLDRPFQSLPVAVSSEGRARNGYWFMPFHKSAKVTVTHEGFHTVGAFYYYIDYRTYAALPENLLYFHAQYRQVTPNPKIDLAGKNLDGRSNYLVMETEGQGQYVGTVLSAQINADGWFGEGDDMFFVDGVETPTLNGTGTEDYFNDAWGFRPFAYPYHGVTVWEGYSTGARVTAYKWHIFDPVAFKRSLRVTIEHGHANDRQDDWYSVGYWYQSLPSPSFPPLANVLDRLPDEGRYYAQRQFIGKEISVHTQNGRWDEAAKRIDEYLAENGPADDYGFWTLRKAVLLKWKGDWEPANGLFADALKKSDRKADDLKARECDAGLIHEFADRENNQVKDKKRVYAYVVTDWQDEYEIFVDGKSAAKGTGGETVRVHEMSLSRGKHLLAIRCKNRAGRAGIGLFLSHPRGYLATDTTWKVSTEEQAGWTERKFDDSKWGAAASVGTLGEEAWASSREGYTFYTSFFAPTMLWTSKDVQEGQVIFLRQEIRL